MEKTESGDKLFTEAELGSLDRQELVKIIIEQQGKLKEKGNVHTHRKRKIDAISSKPDGPNEVRPGSFPGKRFL